MTLQFEQTIDDVVAIGLYNRKHISNAQRIRRLIPVIVLGIVILFSLFNYIVYKDESLFEQTGFVFGVSVVILFLVRTDWFLRWMYKRLYKGKGYASWYGERTLILSEPALIVKTPTTETSYNWAGFIRFGETKEHFFLYTSKIQAITIPKKIFLLPQEEYEVKSFIERKLA